MSTETLRACDLYYEEVGTGTPILLIHPSGSTTATWGSFIPELARIGRVISYDRRGYARTGGRTVHALSIHTADAAALLEYLATPPAVVVGTSAGAIIAIDLAVRRPDLVRAVVAHEAPWRYTRHVPTFSQLAALASIETLAHIGRRRAATEVLLRNAYAYRDGRSAWDAFPAEWRSIARDNARATLADFRHSIGNYPSAADLRKITAPVVCSYGARSAENMARLVERLATAIPTGTAEEIEGAAHAASFDASSNFIDVIASTLGR
jgi:pimeloyl-ACP methyl ester carboxylesterase